MLSTCRTIPVLVYYMLWPHYILTGDDSLQSAAETKGLWYYRLFPAPRSGRFYTHIPMQCVWTLSNPRIWLRFCVMFLQINTELYRHMSESRALNLLTKLAKSKPHPHTLHEQTSVVVTFFPLTPSATMRNVKDGAATTINCAVNPELNSQQCFYYADCRPKQPTTIARCIGRIYMYYVIEPKSPAFPHLFLYFPSSEMNSTKRSCGILVLRLWRTTFHLKCWRSMARANCRRHNNQMRRPEAANRMLGRMVKQRKTESSDVCTGTHNVMYTNSAFRFRNWTVIYCAFWNC